MRHRNKKQKLGRSPEQRKATLSSLASAVILKERIFTTEIKAKKLKPFLEKAISRARKNTVANRRILLKTFPPRIADKLIKIIGPRYAAQAGGYTRIIKYNVRKADGAQMVLMELVK